MRRHFTSQQLAYQIQAPAGIVSESSAPVRLHRPAQRGLDCTAARAHATRCCLARRKYWRGDSSSRMGEVQLQSSKMSGAHCVYSLAARVKLIPAAILQVEVNHYRR